MEVKEELTEEQAREQLKVVTAKLIKISEEAIETNEEWIASNEKLGVNVFSKVEEGSPASIILGKGFIKAAPEQIYPYVYDPIKRAEWDTFYEFGKILKWFKEEEVGIGYFYTKSQFTVWPRDFEIIVGRSALDGSEVQDLNQGFVIAAKSVAQKNESRERDDGSYVRGQVLISGFIVRPLIQDGKTYSEILYIFQVNGAGWLPTSVVDSVNTYQPLGIIGIRKIVTGSVNP